MFESIAQDIRQQFTFGNRITRLIILNTAVFVAVLLVRLFFVLMAGFENTGDFDTFLKYISLNGNILFDLKHPWVIVTHMFVHVGFFHFLFNMLFLLWFGRIAGDFLGDHRIYALYVMGALTGAIFYLAAAPIIAPGGSMAYGASAAVLGITAAAGAIAPDYTMRLLFIGDVRLKYIVLTLVLLDILMIGSLSNTGGHIAHLGGAAFGFAYVAMLKRGTDLAEPVNRLFDWFSGLFKPETATPRRVVKVKHKSKKATARPNQPKRSATDQERIDAILDKIKDSGYESLSEEEKEFLFQISKK